MKVILRYRGREITGDDIRFIAQLIARNRGASRRELSKKLCLAANWVALGQTTGLGHNARTKQATQPKKEVLGYPLRKDFRELLASP